MQSFTFFLDWIISGQFAGLCWAVEKGLYRQAGLEVTLQPWVEDGRSIIDRVVTGGLCAGSSEDNLIVSGAMAGRGVKALGTMLQESPLVLMTKPSSGIRTLQDLPGKRVAMHVDGIRILEAVLALYGIDQAEVEITEVAFDWDNLLQDRFDAVQGYATTEPVVLAAWGVEVRLIPVRHPRLHPYAQVFFTTESCINQYPAVLHNFLQASFEGWRQAMTHRDEAARIVVSLSQGAANLVTERQVIEHMAPYVLGQVGLERFGVLDMERWKHNLESYARFGLISRHPSLAEVIEARFLHHIYQSY
jgi:ABC-type nitrate/sulfonate/bicarbonate transport system substrate-binding protein